MARDGKAVVAVVVGGGCGGSQCAVEVLFLVPLSQDMYLFQPHLCVVCHQFVPHITAKILVAAIQTRGETFFCYPGNKAHSRGGKTCYVGGGT